jgi:hypothetical protein
MPPRTIAESFNKSIGAAISLGKDRSCCSYLFRRWSVLFSKDNFLVFSRTLICNENYQISNDECDDHHDPSCFIEWQDELLKRIILLSRWYRKFQKLNNSTLTKIILLSYICFFLQNLLIFFCVRGIWRDLQPSKIQQFSLIQDKMGRSPFHHSLVT